MTGVVPTGLAVAEHSAFCPHCRELFRNEASLGRQLAVAATESPPVSSLEVARISSTLAHERGVRAFLRSRSTRSRWLLSLGLPAILIARELLRQRVPWRTLSAARLLVGLALTGALAFATWLALRPAPIARRSRHARSAFAFVAWCLPCALWFVSEPHIGGDEGHFALRALACFGYGSALAAPCFVLGWLFDRGLDLPFRVWAFGAGIVALVANLILLVHCPSTERAHLLAGHFSIGFIWFLAVSCSEWWRRHV